MHALSLYMEPRLALKAITRSGRSPIHGDMAWSLPELGDDGTWTPGAWHSVSGPIGYGKHGLHVCGVDNLPYWRRLIRRIRKGTRCRVYVVEYAGQVDIGAHGHAARRVRVLRPWDGKELV